MYREVLLIWNVMEKEPPHGILTNTEVVCAPICCVVHLWSHVWGGVDSGLCYLSWSDDVSCNTWIQEIEHMEKALQAWNFPPWAINTLHNKFNCKHNIHNGHTNNSMTQQTNNNNSGSNNTNISIVGKGLKAHVTTWVSRYTSGGPTPWKPFLWPPRNRDNKLQKSGIIYRFKCLHINCPEEYIGESDRSFGDWFKEHLRAPSPIHLYSHSTGHPVSPNCFIIFNMESQAVTRNIKEAMYIWVNDPSLNRNLGNYQLPHIWDQVYMTHHHSSSNSTAYHPSHPTYGPTPISVPHNKRGGHTQLQCW